MPARQVLHKPLVREGLVKKRRRRRQPTHPGRPTAPFDAPNAIWSADFKGQFKTRDGIYCYPLTVQDGFSRYLLGCQGLAGTTYAGTRRVFTRLFHEFGPSGSAPTTASASPQQNGRHERMHRALKAETTIPQAGNRSAQQRRFNSFRVDFNEAGHTRPTVRDHPPHLLGGEYIGLEEVADDIWAVYFGPVALGWLHVRQAAILDHDGSSSRNPRR